MDLKNLFKKYAKRSKKGFTIVEMVAVVAIIAIASTATISVFIAVQQTVQDTGTITSDQFTTNQIERFIRNELQVASNVDVYDLVGGYPADSAGSYTPKENDEYMFFDPSTSRLFFMKADETDTFHGVLTIDDVEDVSIEICPIDYQKSRSGGSDAKNMQLKLIYNIKTSHYTYSGGMILGNTKTGVKGNMSDYDPDTYCASLEWKDGSPDNNLCVVFHSETAESDTD